MIMYYVFCLLVVHTIQLEFIVCCPIPAHTHTHTHAHTTHTHSHVHIHTHIHQSGGRGQEEVEEEAEAERQDILRKKELFEQKQAELLAEEERAAKERAEMGATWGIGV